MLRSWTDIHHSPPTPRAQALDFSGRPQTLTAMSATPAEFKFVTAIAKANVYFDGRVVSHTLIFPDASRKTLGLIYPGKFHFGTDKAERMEIVAGECHVKLDGETETNSCGAGQSFEVPAKSGFDIEVKQGICEYVCSFLS
jgi:purine/pyrimidine-nucleoside phosphorylase